MEKIIASISHFQIHIFGVMIVVGIVIGLWVALAEAKRRGLNTDKIMDLVIWCILGGLLGARIAFVLFYEPRYYFNNPWDVFKIYNGGLSIHGGLIGGALAGWLYLRKAKLPFWKTADTLTPSIILGQAIGRIGCDVFGKPMVGKWLWGISINQQLLHPTQAYEFVLDYILFFILWSSRKNIRYDGRQFTTYLLIYPLIRSFVELFRDNPKLWGFSVAHYISLTFIIIALVAKFILRPKGELPNLQISKPNKEFWQQLGLTMSAIVLSLLFYYRLYI